MKWLRNLLCRHAGDIAFVRNIHGDEINRMGCKRSIWRCTRCGGTVLLGRPYIFNPGEVAKRGLS